MFKRNIIVLSITLVMISMMVVVSSPAQAGGMWSTWLYNPETHELVRVYVDGTTETAELSVPEGAVLLSSPVFSSAGNWAVYCHMKNTATLVVENLYGNAMAQTFGITFPVKVDFGPAVGCSVSPAAFNTTRDDLIAVSVVYRFENEAGTDLHAQPMWELLIVDLPSQSIVQSLSPASPAIMPLSSIDPSLPFMPRVLAFEGDTITFALEPFAAGGWFTAPTYAWQVGSEHLMAAESDGLPGHNQIALTDEMGQIHATEYIWLGSNPALPPAKHPQDPVDPFNLVLYVAESSDGYPILYQPGHLHAPSFVNHGQHIAVHVVTDDSARWIALDRLGAIIDLPISSDASWLVPAPAGYAYTELGPNANGTRLHHHQFGADATITDNVIWQDGTPGWMVVWTQPLSGNAGQTPFVPLVS